jgi:hypothetical protein
LAYPGEDPATLPNPDDAVGPFVELAAASSTRHGEFVEAAAKTRVS